MMDVRPVAAVRLPGEIFGQEVFYPHRAQLILGRNATGKSTLAGIFRDREGLVLQGECAIHVFDRQYVSDHVTQYTNMPGVVTVRLQDAAASRRMAELEQQLKYHSEQTARLQESLAAVDEVIDNAEARFQDSCWYTSKDLRGTFEKALKGRKTKKAFAEAVQGCSPVPHDRGELELLYRAAYGQDETIYPLFTQVRDPGALDSLPGTGLLGTPILGREDTVFQRTIKRLGAADWVRAGHERFGHRTGGLCPYCQQPISAELEEQILSCFDEEFKGAIRELEQLLESYRNTANAIFVPLQDNLRREHPDLDQDRYLGHLKALKVSIKTSLERIQKKLETPSAVVALEPTGELLWAINEDIAEANRVIQRSNSIVTDRKRKQRECAQQVLELLAHEVRELTAGYRGELSGLEGRRRALLEQIREHDRQGDTLSRELRQLKGSVSDTSSAMETINELIDQAGFTGFRLRPSRAMYDHYEVVRDSGPGAVRLSEGEECLLAYLYFCQRAFAQGNVPRVIVADDPFTGLDPRTAQPVLALTRQLLEQEAQVLVMTYHQEYFDQLARSAGSLQDPPSLLRLVRDGGRTVIEGWQG